jgi:hypothetical protein
VKTLDLLDVKLTALIGNGNVEQSLARVSPVKGNSKLLVQALQVNVWNWKQRFLGIPVKYQSREALVSRCIGCAEKENHSCCFQHY